jgi:aerobic-type carbon monoxide dehydrogenase small subunit (CoxS/CutS family)
MDMPKSNERVVQLVMNGIRQALKVRPNETLAEFLRERLGLTGTKIGCNLGDCGACTVLIDGEPALSCITLAIDCEGRSVLTIEGLGKPEEGALDPIQEAFIENFGVQCGFCTPGTILSVKALLDKNPDPDDQQVKEAIQGNLCRCTGYDQIIESVQAAARKMGRREA